MLGAVRAEVRPVPFVQLNASSALWVLLTIGYSWWATGLETFSWQSTVAIVGGGAVAVGWGTWQRRRGDPLPGDRSEEDRERLRVGRKPGLAIWLALLGALAVLQLVMFTRGPREDYPTISSIINELLGTHGARTVACAAWLAGALRLALRPGVEPPEEHP